MHSTHLSALIVALCACGAHPAAAAVPSSFRRQLQDTTCPCQGCVDAGQTQDICSSWGMDCSCLATCACQGCLDGGMEIAVCASWGLDCSGCDTGCDGDSCDLCSDDPTWSASGHPTWTCNTFAADGINNAGEVPSQYCDDLVDAGQRTLSEGCPVTCESCDGERAARSFTPPYKFAFILEYVALRLPHSTRNVFCLFVCFFSGSPSSHGLRFPPPCWASLGLRR